MQSFDADRSEDGVSATATTAPPKSAGAPFESDTVNAVASVRRALGALVAEIPGGARRPRELQRALGVDYKICWQVFNVIQASDPLAAAKHTPSASALTRFLASGRQLGIAKSRIEAVRSAIDQFNRVVKTHADDREMFHSMVAAIGSEDGDSISDLPHRRAAYRSMSQIWGAQSDAHLVAGAIRRSTSGTALDECLLTVKTGFRRLRTSVSPIVYGSRHGGDLQRAPSHEQSPLNAAAQKKYHAPLLPEFCSRPVPKLRTVAGGGGWLYTKLATEGIGRQSKVDLAFGVSSSGVPIARDEQGRAFGHGGITVRTPTELLIMDVVVHRPSFGLVKPQLLAYQDLPGGAAASNVSLEAPQLRLREAVLPLGPADQVPTTPEWPNYPELLHLAASALRWDLAEFDVFRLRLQYPVFGSVVCLRFPLD